ncbi:MAG TPA: hypothetical protein DCG47_12880 [Spirochaetaceae bacterium]|jgi:hypothetical protein|nr:hypothetical protein [Spirochaetaceae bacterium]
MKALNRYVALLALIATGFASAAAAPNSKAPGQAANFYRGITTLEPEVTTVLVSSSEVVLSSSSVASEPIVTVTSSEPVVVDTRIIGQGEGNPTGNLQDKKAVTVSTESSSTITTSSVIETTNIYELTVTVNSHRGAPASKGKALEPVITKSAEVQVTESTIEKTETVSSTSTQTVVGDWEAAYSVPSDAK